MSYAGNSTVVGDAATLVKEQRDAFRGHNHKLEPSEANVKIANPNTLLDSGSGPETRPFFVRIGHQGLIAALDELDRQIHDSGRPSILSKKHPVVWMGKEIQPGQLGLINHGGLPKLLTRPGRYPPFPFRNWWARTFEGTHGISDTVIEFQGLCVVQVSQNQAAVISDPQNKIFVVKNSGFVAFAVEGSYRVLSIVDQTHLPTPVVDRLTNITLGWTHEVRMQSNVGGGGRQDFVVATFLNIPANNCAILQRGDELEVLTAGQSVITNPSVTLRGLFTLGENQLEMPTKDIFTRDQVPVKQRTLGPNAVQEGASDASSQFLDSLRTQAMDEMHEAALEYGIVLKDLAVIDRQFKGEIASTMDKLTTRALNTQVEAANVDRENQNRVKQEEGALAVARIKAQSQNALADSQAYSIVAAAKAQAEKTKIEAEAQAHATRLAAEAEAEAIRIKSEAEAAVSNNFAQNMALARMEIARTAAFGDRTIFAPTNLGGEMSQALAMGMAAGKGSKSS
uniref:Band 7 domain-containing protein n=1 Tax=Mycena chlorophos TaxID=658473 RepID=A0ABQ0MD44_MYCCL|nr:predicted protein [Mycena chlorophos]